MIKTQYIQAIVEGLHDPQLYVAQVGSLIQGLCRLIVAWVVLMITFTTGFILLAFMFQDPTAWSYETLVSDLQHLMRLVGSVTAFLCLATNVGQFSFVFANRASETLWRQSCSSAVSSSQS